MLVGREAQRQRIQDLTAQVHAGHGAALVLVGEPGIGKTELLGETIRSADGMTVLSTCGREVETTLPFAGLYGLLCRLGERIERLPPPQRAALAAALALDNEPATGPSALAVNAATLNVIADVASERPVLIVVDDAHLIDASSLEALLFAALRIDADPVLFMFATREDAPFAGAGRGLPTITLEGLSVEDAAALLGDTASPDVVQSLVDATGGNPLALLELRATLSPDTLAGRSPLEAPLPVGREIEEWFARRVSRLPEPTRLGLIAAAVCGDRDLRLVERTMTALGVTLTDLEPAELAGLVSLVDGHLEFQHPLLRSAIYQGATPPLRRRVHKLAAEALHDGDPDVRAWHLAAAALGPDEESAAALVEAAERSRVRGAALTAARIAERAAALTPDPEMRAHRLRVAAKVSCDAGRLDPAIALLDEAAQLAREPGLAAEIKWYQGGVNIGRGQYIAGFNALLAGVELLDPIDPAHAATLMCWAIPVLHLRLDAPGLLAAAERVAALVSRTTLAPSPLESAQEARGEALALLGRGAEGVALMVEVATTAEPARGEYVIESLREALVWVEAYELARTLLERELAAGRASGSTVAAMCSDLADLEFRTGHWARALSLLNEAMAIAEQAGQTKQRGHALSRLVVLDAAIGQESECRRHFAELCERGGEAADLPLYRCRTRAALGLLDLGAGRVNEAISHLETVSALMSACGIREPGVVWWAADLIQAYVQAGRIADARRELDVFSELACESGRTWALAAVARCRGLLAARTKADDLFAEALDWHSRTPTPFEVARTRFCYGQVLRRDGQRVSARDQLRAALSVFETLGARAWIEQARKELRASGEVLRRHGVRSASGELTPQELQIAFLITEGATNKEVAARLFLSPKTIENHLGRIYRKLEVRGRTELASRMLKEKSPPDDNRISTLPAVTSELA